MRKLRSRTQRLVFLVAVLTLSAGCSQLQKKEGRPSDSRTEDRPFDGDRTKAPVTLAGPERKVALILGPGGYKTFAHAGVLKSLAKNNIPIHAVVGVEWGALPAALFAQRAQVHEAEWKLYKLEKLNLENQDFFGRRKGPQKLDVLEAYMRENLDVQRSEDTKIPFFCPQLNLRTGAVQLSGRGRLSQIVMGCMGAPPLFRPYGNAAALLAWNEIVNELVRAGYDTMILVNVLGQGSLVDKEVKDDASLLLWYEARRSLWQAKGLVSDVIEVSTNGVPLGDFESRRLLTTAGERAGDRAARELADKYDF